jgi:hypothetical protein
VSTEEYLRFYLKLLELEIEALRSVLSEYDEEHSQYAQWIKAEAIKELKNSLRYP